uniref:Protein kinase n=1 Tax=Leptospirillum ferrodiazotrophum TaxID=412449 RepID=C6HUE3_9BACT|nr:MAG: protein kinase [Leptospirillum ferrodiazotrophum]
MGTKETYMIVETLRSWLCDRWPDYYRPTRELEGFYGLVFILEARETNIFPEKFCVKTMKPDKLRFSERDIKGLFEREMRLWLGIPFHPHVLPALGLELVPAPIEFANKFAVLPLVRMPFCDANLTTFTKGEDNMSSVDRLIILAQVCSGLQWLYQHGLQGHGDLKPDNILLRDLRRSFHLPDGDGIPSNVHYWQARIADLGWADIWTQGGGTSHAWNPYIAPERFHNNVVPEASDIFAIGVIACELLSGVHPGGGTTEVLAKKWNEKEWEAWASSTQRVVDVKPPELRDIILRCLEADPNNRPTVGDLKVTLCDLLRKIHGLELAPQLRAEDEEAGKLVLPSHGSWVATEMSLVSPD